MNPFSQINFLIRTTAYIFGSNLQIRLEFKMEENLDKCEKCKKSNTKGPPRRSELKSKLTFLLGIFVGYFLLRSSLFEVLEQNLTQTTTWILFQTNLYNEESECPLHNYDLDEDEEGCREFVDCRMCEDVFEIDIINNEDMNQELFKQKYDRTGRPVLVKNVTNNWKAATEFNFEFFKNLFLELDSPVLLNEDDDCEFLTWDVDFTNVEVQNLQLHSTLQIHAVNSECEKIFREISSVLCRNELISRNFYEKTNCEIDFTKDLNLQLLRNYREINFPKLILNSFLHFHEKSQKKNSSICFNEMP